MVWQRMIQRLRRRNRRSNNTCHETNPRRSLRLESLAKRELLASDLGVITGVSYIDLTGDGLTADDTRLEGVTVELFRDVDANGVLDAADGAAIDSQVTDADGQYRFAGLNADTFFVVQQNAAGDILEPGPVAVTIADDSGALLVTIDDFTTTAQDVMATTTVATDSSSLEATETLGGFRDMSVTRTSDIGVINVVTDPPPDLLSVGSQTESEGVVLLQYDGDDNSLTLDPTGLGGIALAGGASTDPVDPGTGILIDGSYQNAGDQITVRIYTDADNFATATADIPEDTGVVGEQEQIFIPFADFTATGTPNFNDVGAIEFEITVSANNDGTFVNFNSLGSNVQTVNLANTQLMSLGGNVFRDAGGGTDTNNGMLDAGEPGIEGVVVDLYAEPEGGGAIDPSNQTPIQSTTSDADGNYRFDELAPGDYVVVIPQSEFAETEPLFGFVTSTGNDPVPDPNDDVVGDDNGEFVEGVGLVTGVVELTVGGESVDDGDTDSNTNLTVGFGVVPTIDLQVTKTLDETASDLQEGGTAFFDITFQNGGPADATNVVLTDVLPAGLTLDPTNSDFGSFTPTIDGQNVSINVGSLASGATGSIRIAADIATGQTADLTNTVSIDGDEVDVDPDNNTDDAVLDLVNTDLEITKSDNTDGPVVAGEQFTYTIKVSNVGPDDATGVIATDNLPDDVTFVNATFVTGSGTVTEDPTGSGDLTIEIGDLAANGEVTVDIVVLVNSDAADMLTNQASVTSTPNNDNNPSNDTVQEMTDVERNVDVEITKTTTDTATAGGQLTYTIDVSNAGPSDARDVEVTDTLAAALTFVSFDAGTTDVTIDQTGQDLTFDVGTLASGETKTFTITVDLASSATGTLSNTVDVTTTDNDTDNTNDSDTLDLAVGTATDLVLTKEVDAATAVPGEDTLTYTFTISHDTDSASDSGEVTFTDALPAGVTGVTIDAPEATSSGFDTDMQTVTIVFDPIPIGQTRTFTVTASVNEDATGTIENTGSITVDGGDMDTANNSATATTDATPEFDVTIDKTVDDSTPDPGSNVTYTIDLTNDGPSTATGVILTDDVPTGLTFVSGTLDGQSATLSGSTVTFPEITLEDGETLTATLVFTVGIDADGTITNTASVTADDGETDTENNSDQAAITASPIADLTVTKTVDETAAQIGETLTYTITVTNDGVSTAIDSEAVDTLPADFNFVSGTGPNDEALTVSNGTITVDGGDLAPGESFTFTVSGTIDTDATGTLTNNVAVTTATTESSTANNSASAATTVDPVTSTISGTVYVDSNNNGVQDSGEEGIEGVELRLSGTDSQGNQINRVVTTDADGVYEFDQLPAGTYRIDQVQPDGFRSGQETVGTGATATAVDNAFTDLELGVDTDAIDFNFAELEERLSKRRFLASS
ncbi:DUF11 domain-containing protein [Roseiconus nitratireducens]|uniref:DUF11 domain-containing protein n=1 Tax=Roseiconus nitratireducens TaxID=2605748 RepID=A0A5M6DBL3_9BACT|nr:SdrD B-like domain-containing protein [Roseiconus nitratireducens]KAA5543790.1 DUF11 domain-containing protein [Roseiconus nitratireducens]